MWTTAAPNLGKPFMSEPSVYTQFSGMNFGVHGWGTGGRSSVGEERWKGGHVMGSEPSRSGNISVDVWPTALLAVVHELSGV